MDTERTRTEFILTNMYIHVRNTLSLLDFNVKPMISLNSKEVDVLYRVCKLGYLVFQNHGRKISRFSKKFHAVKQKNLELLMMSVYEQLFTDHISWYRIILFLNIAMYCYWVNVSGYYVLLVLSRIAKLKLQTWIDDHKGWESVHIDEHQVPFPQINRTTSGRLRKNKK